MKFIKPYYEILTPINGIEILKILKKQQGLAINLKIKLVKMIHQQKTCTDAY